MKILLTGASGMVGRNVLESPQSSDYELLTPSHKELDLLDKLAVKNYLDKNRPDMVIHAAGVVGGIYANIKEPLRFLTENLEMGKNIICNAYQIGVKKFINIAASCMYPRNHDTPLNEDMILTGELEPTNEGFALAKICCTKMCNYITRENSLYQYKTLIPCNLYGRWDKFSAEKAHLIPAIIQKIVKAINEGQTEIEIWGDGTSRREFMYAGDLAEFIWQAVARFDELPEIINVGTGRDFSVNEYYSIIAKVAGFNGNFNHDLNKPTGMNRKLTEVSRMRRFGWKPKTSLEDGIKQTIDFYRANIINHKGN